MKPIISSGFGYDPVAMNSLVRKFYERWHAQGGQSARDYCGIAKRARDYRDLRNDLDRDRWERTDMRLRREKCRIILAAVGEQKKAKVVQLYPVSSR